MRGGGPPLGRQGKGQGDSREAALGSGGRRRGVSRKGGREASSVPLGAGEDPEKA